MKILDINGFNFMLNCLIAASIGTTLGYICLNIKPDNAPPLVTLAATDIGHGYELGDTNLVLEFTPKSRPNYSCIVISNTYNDRRVSMQCVPKIYVGIGK